MRKLFILSSLVALSTSVMAMDLEYFIGAGAERGSINAHSSSIGSTDTKDTALKLKAGVIMDKNHRISISRVGYTKNGQDIDLTALNYDYIIPFENKFSLLVGAHLGKAEYDTNGFNMDGAMYGAQAGALYDLTSNIQLETTFEYSKYNVDTDVNGTKIELKHSTALYLGFNYKF
ncbi:hypothetical protein [Arcobacter sp.]|uniref:hypothetical protein n=1 Tax=Arcobacter sp. TaxID=1872629 RepID=UPI003D101227